MFSAVFGFAAVDFCGGIEGWITRVFRVYMIEHRRWLGGF